MRRRIALAETSSADAIFVAITPRYRCPCARMRSQSNDSVAALQRETRPAQNKLTLLEDAGLAERSACAL